MANFSEQLILTTTIPSGAAITSGAVFVKVNSSGKVELASTSEKSLGVLRLGDTPTILDEDTPVVVSGIVMVRTGAAVSIMDPVTSDSSGRAIPVTAAIATVITGGATATLGAINVTGGKLPIATNGFALDAASGANEYIRVRLV